MRAIEAITAKGETSALCQSIGVSRASLYRRRRPTPPATPRRPRAPSPRALVPAERRAVHFSRYVVGWMVAVKESAHLAERLIEQTCAKQRIQPQQLTIHADRGAPMRSKLVALLFSDLSIAASHSRPRVSNDNPFSEAQFRTFKYRPEFPPRWTPKSGQYVQLVILAVMTSAAL